MCICLHVKYPLSLSDFNETLIFSFSQNTQTHFMKIRPVGAMFSHADGQTGMSKLIVGFNKFSNTTKNKN